MGIILAYHLVFENENVEMQSSSRKCLKRDGLKIRKYKTGANSFRRQIERLHEYFARVLRMYYIIRTNGWGGDATEFRLWES